MSKNFEIAENPEILVDKDFDINLVQLGGLKLGDDYKKINLLDVVEVYVPNYKEPYTNFSDRIKQLENNDGFIHMAGKFGFRIKNQKISAIELRGKYIEKLQEYNKKRVVDIYGEPNKILTDSITWVTDYVEHAKILVYSEKSLYIFIDSKTKKIGEIRIGDVNEKFFSI